MLLIEWLELLEELDDLLLDELLLLWLDNEEELLRECDELLESDELLDSELVLELLRLLDKLEVLLLDSSLSERPMM